MSQKLDYKRKSHSMGKVLQGLLQEYIHQNVIGWEVVICDLCGEYEDDCKAPCPVALAIKLRDVL